MSTYNHDNHDCRERVILEEYEKLSPDLIFEIIRHDGEEELERKTKPLILSGLAAGIIISFSFYFKAILAMYVGHTLWAEAISGFGYTTGFLMVILGRLQLFTENTITTVLPFMKHPNMENLMKLFRLWAIVLSANFVGTFIAALFLWLPAFAQPGITEALSELVCPHYECRCHRQYLPRYTGRHPHRRHCVDDSHVAGVQFFHRPHFYLLHLYRWVFPCCCRFL